MNVCRSGTSVWSRAKARTSSRLGPTSRSAVSAATAIQLLEGVLERQAARGQQHAQVIEHVGRLLAHTLVRLVARRARDLLGLLAHLLADERRIREEPGRVARLGGARAPLRDRALEHGQGLVGRRRLEGAVVGAGALAPVAGGGRGGPQTRHPPRGARGKGGPPPPYR